MRIWEQGLVATYSMPGYKALIEEHYRAFQRPGTTCFPSTLPRPKRSAKTSSK